MNPFDTHLDQTPANYVPLTPLSFLARAGAVYPNHTSVMHGSRRFSWSQTRDRCHRLAGALAARGISPGDTVAVIAPNTTAMFETAYGVPMAGAILNTINTRLDAATVALILEHGEAKALLADAEFAPLVEQVLEMRGGSDGLLVVRIDDEAVVNTADFGAVEYEALLDEGDAAFAPVMPADEWQAISLNYTSGTTGRPKGVVYHHRGAYLNAMSNIVGWSMAMHPTYLWTLPMFHCNGWCFPWSIAAVGGTNVCLRKVEAGAIYDAIADHGVTHLCGAPIVLSLIINAGDGERRDFGQQVKIMTAAAPPPASVLEEMQRQGFDVTHVYGLTETYGPAVICAWHDEWNALPAGEQARLKSRQGVAYHALEGLDVMDPETMKPVPRDGETLGEVMFRGNVVMRGYLKNADATAASLQDGWFHSGDLGVMYPDGYLQLKDRSKDIIISGGENISSIEVEDALYAHPDVMDAAVVARRDDKWGETPCAFVTLRAGADASEADLMAWCREKLAHFKAPRTVVFGDLPKTSTGKVQKFQLRERADALET